MALNRPLVAMDLSTSGPTIMPGTPPKQQQWHISPPPPRTSRMLMFLPPLLIAFPISIALFVLEQLTVSIFSSHKDLTIEYGVMLNSKPTTLMMWTSVITAILSVLTALAFWELRGGHEKRARFWAFTNILITLGNVALVVACTVVTFKAQEADKNVDLVDFFPELIIAAGTRETIFCTLKDVGGGRFWAKAGCGFATTGRWMLVPLFICSIVLVGLCFWQIIERGGANWMFGGRKEGKKMQGTELGEHV